MLHWVKGLTFLIHNLKVRAWRWHHIHQLQPSFMHQAMVCTPKQRAMVDIFKLCVVQPSWSDRPLMNKGELHGVANLSPSTTAPWHREGHLKQETFREDVFSSGACSRQFQTQSLWISMCAVLAYLREQDHKSEHTAWWSRRSSFKCKPLWIFPLYQIIQPNTIDLLRNPDENTSLCIKIWLANVT